MNNFIKNNKTKYNIFILLKINLKLVRILHILKILIKNKLKIIKYNKHKI